MNVLSWLGGFVQQTITTNTAVEIAGSIADIHYDHKRGRAIACLISAIVGAGGGATLFVLEPSIHAYFQTIVLQAVPFIGPIATTVFVGILGGWFGGGFGHNVAKEVVREYAEKNIGVSNMAYDITDADVTRIVEENPQIYNYNYDHEQGFDNQDIANIKAQDVQNLKNLLLMVRDQIIAHKADKETTTAHGEAKYALLSALRLSNLTPVLEFFQKSDTKREVRKQAAVNAANYFADVNAAQYFGQPAEAPRQARAARPRRARNARRGVQQAPVFAQQSAQPVRLDDEDDLPNPHQADGEQIQVVQPVEAVQMGVPVGPVPVGPVQMIDLNQPPAAARAQQRAAVPEHINLRPDAVIFENLRRQIQALNQGEVRDVRRVKRSVEHNDLIHALNPFEKRELLVSLKHTFQQQNQKQMLARENANPLLRKAFVRNA